MFDPDSPEERLLFLLNSFAGAVNHGPWVVQKSTGYHMDYFGESIHGGDAYFARSNGTQEMRRLSLHSAQLIWQLLIEDNDRQEEFRQSMLRVQQAYRRGEAEAEAESYEDMHED